ncbi:recombinase family protein [Streptomyces sp. NPDC058525]|uniref:recombinase family protein n=1 Tax=Streptomyces sp. NPDC058525 TaxID=3346538 RepID=UPI003667B925
MGIETLTWDVDVISITCTVRIMNKHALPRLRLVIYLRVSTKGQVDTYGFPSQLKDCKTWNKPHNHRIVEVLREEAESGATDEEDRPELARALDMIANGDADGILFPNLDRLARELTIQEAALSVVWAHGGRAFGADQGEILPDDDSDPMRTFVRQVMGAAAQLERGLIKNRLRKGRAAKGAADGYAYGAPRYGFKAEKKALVEVPDETAGEARAKELRAQVDENGKQTSYREICRILKEENFKTKRGGEWRPSTIAKMLDPEYRAKANERDARARQAKRDDAVMRKAAKARSRFSDKDAGEK